MAITEITGKMTPAEVDNILVNTQWDLHKAITRIAAAKESLPRDRENLDVLNSYLSEENLNEASKAFYQRRKEQCETRIASATQSITEHTPIMKTANKQIDACNTEYNRRGGWTRFWLVNSTNHGHIHSSRECSTCFPTTTYAWLPDLSGSNEEEVVELAGERACTVCFPDAPVDVLRRPSRIEDPARRAEREERERKAAEKAKKIAQKAISAPDGSALRIKGHWSVVKTEAEAQRLYVNARVSLLLHESGDSVIHNDRYKEEIAENAKTLLPALAHKRETTEEEQYELLEKKAKAKIKREWRITL